MIYQELLYSRSLSKDYRWMMIPPQVSLESLKVLNQLYNFYDTHKNIFRRSSVSPLYCINQPETTFLVSCGLSEHKDKDGRDIYCLQGISVAQKYKRHFWFILPWILNNYDSEQILNTWQKIHFSAADDMVRRISENCAFKLDQLDETIAELTKETKSITENLPAQVPVYIPFDKEGLKELSHVISSYHHCIDFAFGATPEMVKAFDFKIIAKAGSRSDTKTATHRRTANASPAFTSGDREMAAHEPVHDPIDRFDPRRKKDDLNESTKPPSNKNQQFMVHGSSYLLGQFLPRVLSLLKVGKKLKNRFKD